MKLNLLLLLMFVWTPLHAQVFKCDYIIKNLEMYGQIRYNDNIGSYKYERSIPFDKGVKINKKQVVNFTLPGDARVNQLNQKDLDSSWLRKIEIFHLKRGYNPVNIDLNKDKYYMIVSIRTENMFQIKKYLYCVDSYQIHKFLSPKKVYSNFADWTLNYSKSKNDYKDYYLSYGELFNKYIRNNSDCSCIQ